MSSSLNAQAYRKNRFAIVVLFEASGVRRIAVDFPGICFVVARFFDKGGRGAINGQRLCVRVRARVRMGSGGGFKCYSDSNDPKDVYSKF